MATNATKMTTFPVGDLRNGMSFMSLRYDQLRVALHAHDDDTEDVLGAQVRATTGWTAGDREVSRRRGLRRNNTGSVHNRWVIDVLANTDVARRCGW